MPEQPKLTKEGLPIVSRSTLEDFIRDLDSKLKTPQVYAEYVIQILKDIERTNPEVYNFLNVAVKTKPEEGISALGCALDLYELMRRQAESNKKEIH